jgi:glycosyltransferase involved in cell wall biosynthesis
MRSYVTHGENGLLVPEREPQALKDAIMSVLNDDALRTRLESAARNYAETHLDIYTQTGMLAEFFNRILATRSS